MQSTNAKGNVHKLNKYKQIRNHKGIHIQHILKHITPSSPHCAALSWSIFTYESTFFKTSSSNARALVPKNESVQALCWYPTISKMPSTQLECHCKPIISKRGKKELNLLLAFPFIFIYIITLFELFISSEITFTYNL